jgi:hypothetical protein
MSDLIQRIFRAILPGLFSERSRSGFVIRVNRSGTTSMSAEDCYKIARRQFHD